MDYTVTWSDEIEASNQDLTVVPDTKAWFPATGGPLYMNSWQMMPGGLPTSSDRFSAVYACRKVLAEEVARLRAYHYREMPDGGKLRQRSRLSRILRYPNAWQSRVDFWLNMVDELLRDGNAYALAERDDAGAITSLTPLKSAWPFVDPLTGAVFYGIGFDLSTPMPQRVRPEDLDEPRYLVPAREVFHLRLFTPVNPLVGESPLVAARVSADTGTAISNSTFSFFNRAARPSGYLRHPKRVSEATRKRLAAAWTDNYSGVGTGGTAILEEGLEWHPMSMSAVDAEIVDQYRLTVEDVARVYRVPLFMLGDMAKSTFNNVETMTRAFYAGGLGFYLELIEAQLASFFDLGMDEFVEFDVESGLMRSEFKDRVDGLTKGVQGGVFAPNEARRREGLPAVEHGDEPLVQQQMVPLTYATQQTVNSGPESIPVPAPAEEEPTMSASETRTMVRRMLKVA